MLAYNWIILSHDHLFSHGAGVFLSYVKMASPRSGVQAYFDGGRLRHVSSLFWVRATQFAALLCMIKLPFTRVRCQVNLKAPQGCPTRYKNAGGL